MVEGRVGEHEAERRDARGDRCGDGNVLSSFEEDNGAGFGCEQFSFRFRDEAILANQFDRINHQSERPVLSVFSLPEPFYRDCVQGVAGEVESTDAFDGDNLPVRQKLPRALHRVVHARGRKSGFNPALVS